MKQEDRLTATLVGGFSCLLRTHLVGKGQRLSERQGFLLLGRMLILEGFGRRGSNELALRPHIHTVENHSETQGDVKLSAVFL